VISTSVPNFIEIQNTWCNPFAHLAWNDPNMTELTKFFAVIQK